jgi:HlyD family secretion protein
MRKAIVAVVVVGLAAAGVFWWQRTNAAAEPLESAPQFEPAKRGPLRQVVQCTGRTVSNLDVEIKCRASGEVIQLPYDISDPVQKGDLLLELDPVEQERIVEIAKADLAAAEARLAQAESNVLTAEANLVAERQRVHANLKAAQARAADAKAKAQREQELLQKKFSSPEEAETARTAAVQAEQELQAAEAALEGLKAQELELEARRQEVNLSKAQVESSKIDLALRQRQLTYTKVFAPIDGVVADRQVQIGQIISSGVTNVGGGTTVMILSDLSHIYILASVDESDIGEVMLGQTAEITVDAYPRQQFTGQVDRIATKGVNLQNVVTFEVRVEVTSENKNLLKPEMTANVNIIVAERDDTLLVPATAIIRERRDTFVELKGARGMETIRQPVDIGISDGMFTEIVAGLKEGEMVLVQRPEDESRWRNSDDRATTADGGNG